MKNEQKNSKAWKEFRLLVNNSVVPPGITAEKLQEVRGLLGLRTEPGKTEVASGSV